MNPYKFNHLTRDKKLTQTNYTPDYIAHKVFFIILWFIFLSMSCKINILKIVRLKNRREI